jgi:hypothetical protein
VFSAGSSAFRGAYPHTTAMPARTVYFAVALRHANGSISDRQISDERFNYDVAVGEVSVRPETSRVI